MRHPPHPILGMSRDIAIGNSGQTLAFLTTIQKETIMKKMPDPRKIFELCRKSSNFFGASFGLSGGVSVVFVLWRPLSLMHKPRSLSWDLFTGLLRPPENFRINVIVFLVCGLMS